MLDAGEDPQTVLDAGEEAISIVGDRYERGYLALMGDSFALLLHNPAKLDLFQTALQEIQEASEPAACWDQFSIRNPSTATSAPSKSAAPTTACDLTPNKLRPDEYAACLKRGLR